jgi:hypothetical protein
MSVISPPFGPPPPFPVHRLTVDQYHQMIQAAILSENDRVELLDGWIVPKMPHDPTHDGAIDKSHDAILDVLPPGWRIRTQEAITTADSEPEPDLAVVPRPADRFVRRHPTPADIALLIEISDSTLDFDRNSKGPSYARAGMVIYWIVNLVNRQVEVYTDPTGPDAAPRYRNRQDYPLGESVPVVINGVEVGKVPVQALLP